MVWVVGRDGQLIECIERGSQIYDLLPNFPADDPADARALVAQADARLAGTAFPTSLALPSADPETTTIDLFTDPEDDDEFAYGIA